MRGVTSCTALHQISNVQQLLSVSYCPSMSAVLSLVACSNYRSACGADCGLLIWSVSIAAPVFAVPNAQS